jgi:hypothetical protein
MRRRTHYFKLADNSPGGRGRNGNIGEVEKMDDRLVHRGYGNYYPVTGLKFLRDRANGIDRVHSSVIIRSVIIGDCYVSGCQASNGSAGNGSVSDAGTIPVENDATRADFPYSGSVTGTFAAGSEDRAVKEDQSGNFKESDHKEKEDRQGHG